MNRLPFAAIHRLPGTPLLALRYRQLAFPQIKYHRKISTTPRLYSNSPAGAQERPVLPSDENRTAQSPKSSDEKIMDRAQQGEKDKAPFSEEEQERKGLDQKESINKDEEQQQKA